jgi:hypothetical protein
LNQSRFPQLRKNESGKQERRKKSEKNVEVMKPGMIVANALLFWIPGFQIQLFPGFLLS